MNKSVCVFINCVKTVVNVPEGYEDNFKGYKFTNHEQFNKAVECATLAKEFVISGILCRNSDDVQKANFYHDELHRIIEANNDDYLAAMYDAREDVSDYEMSSCMCA